MTTPGRHTVNSACKDKDISQVQFEFELQIKKPKEWLYNHLKSHAGTY